MGVARNKLCKGVSYGNDWFAEHFALHTIGYPKCTGTCHTAAFGTLGASQFYLHIAEFNNKNTLLYMGERSVSGATEYHYLQRHPNTFKIGCKITLFFQFTQNKNKNIYSYSRL
jgi:hypothetical protein